MFMVPGWDGGPLKFPPVGPYWITNTDGEWTRVVAYAPTYEVLTNGDHWPDAVEIDDQGEQDVVFTDRFPCPVWWKGLA